ncbi:MAG TPA: DUF929 family protein [Acidimicrobiales bacterium]|nr:DUF929 family protein [Acidimicrobiales bacterium]
MAKSSQTTSKGSGTPVPPRQKNRKPGAPARGRQARQAQHRRNRMIAWLSVAAVVVIVAVVVAVGLSSSGSSGGPPREPAPAVDVAKLTSIPMSTLTGAAGTVSNLYAAQPINDKPLTSGGKPEMLYIGAEFCPICATERWPMLVALSHFGTFTGVKQTHSALRDGDISTLSFYGSTFTSPYLAFVPVETTTNQPEGQGYKPLETPTKAEAALWQKYDPAGDIPFIDIGGKYLLETAQFPDTLLSGLSFNTIVSEIGANNNTVGAAVDAAATALVKYICTITNNQPAKTCQAVAGVNVPGTVSKGPSSKA